MSHQQRLIAATRKAEKASLRKLIRSVNRQANDGYISIAGLAPDFTGGVESAKYIKARWERKAATEPKGTA